MGWRRFVFPLFGAHIREVGAQRFRNRARQLFLHIVRLRRAQHGFDIAVDQVAAAQRQADCGQHQYGYDSLSHVCALLPASVRRG